MGLIRFPSASSNCGLHRMLTASDGCLSVDPSSNWKPSVHTPSGGHSLGYTRKAGRRPVFSWRPGGAQIHIRSSTPYGPREQYGCRGATSNRSGEMGHSQVTTWAASPPCISEQSGLRGNRCTSVTHQAITNAATQRASQAPGAPGTLRCARQASVSGAASRAGISPHSHPPAPCVMRPPTNPPADNRPSATARTHPARPRPYPRLKSAWRRPKRPGRVCRTAAHYGVRKAKRCPERSP
jgi:hypothetical protein